jgi:YD repeat-containing protein
MPRYFDWAMMYAIASPHQGVCIGRFLFRLPVARVDSLVGSWRPFSAKTGRVQGVIQVRCQATVQIANTGTTNFQYPSTSNRLLSSTGGMVKSYTYDASGSITGDGTNVFSYDGRGRLAQVTAGSDTTQYAINGLGQRVAKCH